MADPFLGEIKLFAGNFAPRGYALANGQILPIAQNTALFSLFGTNYGGNGTSTFALPDFQGRAPMNQGNGAGLSPYVVGESAGTPTVTLTAGQVAGHTHTMTGEDEEANPTNPNGNLFGVTVGVRHFTVPGAPGLQLQPMAATAVGSGGGNQPHNNMQPFLGLSFIVALQGIFPSRQ